MEKQIIINGNKTNFWIEDTGRLRNSKTKRWLKGAYNKGVHFYSLYFRGKQYVFYTHRLVAKYFVPNPDRLPIVRHKDGDKTNNFYLNLEWVSNEKAQEYASQMCQKKKGSRLRINIDDYPEIAQFRNSPYYATKDGDILNLDKKIKMRTEKSGNYLRVQTAYNLHGKHFLVHRMVWEAFNGKIPDKYDIDHIDGNPHNNALNNLEAVPHVINIKRRKIDFSYVADNLYYGK